MSNKLSKAEQRKLIVEERHMIEETINALSPRLRTQRGVTDAGWSVKDVMAHLAEWEQMFLGWYAAGVRGEKPELPAPGYNFSAKSLNQLNDAIYRKYRPRSFADVQALFAQSHRDVLQWLDATSEDELNTPARYAWMGKHNLSQFLAANTWNHYRWARTMISKWSKRINP